MVERVACPRLAGAQMGRAPGRNQEKSISILLNPQE